MAKADYYVPDERPWFKYYPKGVPHHLDYPEVPLYQFLDDSAEKHPDNIALVFYGKEITYKELKELSDKFANALQNLGIQKGDRVAFLLPNCPQFVIGFYGTMKAGAVPVPLNPLYTGEELKYFFKDAEPRIMLTLDVFYEKVKQGAEVTPQIEKIIVTNIADYFPPTKRILGKLLGKIKSPECEDSLKFKEFLNISPDYNKIEINPKEDLAVILYTGGTTGEPKGVMLSHFNIVSNAFALNKWLKKVKFKSAVIVVPFFHIYAISSVLSLGVLRNIKFVLLPKFKTEETIQTIQKYKINYFPGVPAMYAAFWKYCQKKHQYSLLESLTLCGSGTTSISSYLLEKISKMAPQSFLDEGYGLSETSPLLSIDSPSNKYKKKIGSVGVPFVDTDVKIIDSQNGRELLPNQTGEIVTKGPQIFRDYWKKPEKTKEVLKDGWFHTKDIGKMDKDGIFYIEGRLDNMINIRGEKVWPREIERVLEANPKVQDVAVIGVKDDYYGQTIKACIVLKEGFQLSEKELVDFCKNKLTPYKIPRMVEFFKELPKTHLGKILHYKLRVRENNKNK